MYNQFGERIGQEGRAREQIMLTLFKNGWVRIRKYKTFWVINVKRLAGRIKSYVTQWAKKVLKGLHCFEENDPYIQIKIDQDEEGMKTIDLKTMADSDKFIPEHVLVEKKVNELTDLETYDMVNKIMYKRRSFKGYLDKNWR